MSVSSYSSNTSTSTCSSTAQSNVWLVDNVIKKSSKEIDYCTENEIFIGGQLNKLAHPNIVRLVGHEMSNGSPVSCWENLVGEHMLDFIKNGNAQASFNCTQQVLLLILHLRSIGFVHGDLHTRNVMICKTNCNKIDYVIDNVTFTLDLVPIGHEYYVAKIFDFGHSVVWTHLNTISTPLFAYAEGFGNPWYDSFHDVRLFLSAVLFELKSWYNDQFVVDLERVLTNMVSFYPNYNNGNLVWKTNPLDKIERVMLHIEHESVLFGQSPLEALELLAHFVPLPLVECAAIPERAEYFARFLNQWAQLDRFLAVSESLALLKKCIDFVLDKKADLAHKDSVDAVENEFFELVVSEFKRFGHDKLVFKTKSTNKLLHLFSIMATVMVSFMYEFTLADAKQVHAANALVEQAIIEKGALVSVFLDPTNSKWAMPNKIFEQQ